MHVKKIFFLVKNIYRSSASDNGGVALSGPISPQITSIYSGQNIKNKTTKNKP